MLHSYESNFVQQRKGDVAEAALISATNECEEKKAYRSKCMI